MPIANDSCIVYIRIHNICKAHQIKLCKLWTIAAPCTKVRIEYQNTLHRPCGQNLGLFNPLSSLWGHFYKIALFKYCGFSSIPLPLICPRGLCMAPKSFSCMVWSFWVIFSIKILENLRLYHNLTNSGFFPF